MNPALKNTGLMAAATFAALIAFGPFDYPPAYALLISLPVLWACTTRRLAGGGVMAVYGGIVSHSLPESLMAYTHGSIPELLLGVGYWAITTLLFFGVGCLCWHYQKVIRILRIPLLLLVWTLPPFGLIGWGNPLLSAGWTFPHWHWFGLVAVVITMMLVAYRPVFLIVPLFCFLATQHLPVSSHPNWAQHDTRYTFGTQKSVRDLTREFSRHRDMSNQLRTSTRLVHLYPETVGGHWNDTAALYWQTRLRQEANHQTVLIGASIRESGILYNSIILVSAEHSRPIYRQRLPVPVTMWNPLVNDGYAMALTPNFLPVSDVAGTRTAFLLCYETLIALPALHSLLYKPHHLAVSSSLWWAPDSIKKAQQAAALSWARLFNLTLNEAYND